jgi:hypothetical protein
VRTFEMLAGQMRYHFHLTDLTERILDDAGIEVDGPEQAYSEAIAAIQEMRAEAGESIAWDGWKLEITDPAGAVIFSISLSDRVH